MTFKLINITIISILFSTQPLAGDRVRLADVDKSMIEQGLTVKGHGNTTPLVLDVSPSSETLTKVWAGNSNEVGVSWGQGTYYVEIDFGCNNKGGSLWVSVKDMSDTQVVGIPSPFNYEGNYHISYEHARMKAYQTKTCGKPTIRKISKLN